MFTNSYEVFTSVPSKQTTIQTFLCSIQGPAGGTIQPNMPLVQTPLEAPSTKYAVGANPNGLSTPGSKQIDSHGLLQQLHAEQHEPTCSTSASLHVLRRPFNINKPVLPARANRPSGIRCL